MKLFAYTFLVSSILFKFFVMPAFSANPATSPSVGVSAAGVNTNSILIPPSDLSGAGVHNIFSLYIGATVSGGSYFTPFYKNGSIYQVTPGSTAYCFDMTASSSYTNPTFPQLVSATATFANNATTLTGAVYQCGANNTACLVIGANSVPIAVPGVYKFGSSTWPGIQAYNFPFIYMFHMDCFEQ